MDSVLDKSRLAPQGTWYEATVPDTIDLVERARFSINALTNNVDPDTFYGVYQGFTFNEDPPQLQGLTWNITVKNARTLPALRAMTGSDYNLETEYRMMRALLGEIREDGLVYYPFDGQAPPKGTSYPQTNASTMFAILNWYGRDGNPEWLKWVDLLAKGLRSVAISVEDRAFYPMQAGRDPQGNWHIMNIGQGPVFERPDPPPYDPVEEPEADALGYEGSAKAEANRTLAALARHYRMTGDSESLQLARKILRFVLKARMWSENSDEARYPGYEHGIWMGHFHNGGTQALNGLLEMALATNSDWLKQFVREGYDHSRRNGVLRLGWFPAWSSPERYKRPGWLGGITEPCALSDVVLLAVRMSDAGLGDYWDDVDSIIRNHLIEQQIIDLDQMRKVSGVRAGSDGEQLLRRFQGGFAAGTPTRIGQYSVAGCCTANGAQGIYYAWHGITRFDRGVATVNLFLNRASPWMDVDSFLPYQGKVVLHNKQAHTALVRIPGWVDAGKVQSWVERATGSKQKAEPPAGGRYLLFQGLQQGDKIVLEFPLTESRTQYTINGKKYTVSFRGSTVVDIGPFDADGESHYVLYQRGRYKSDKAPLRKIRRFAADKLVPLGVF